MRFFAVVLFVTGFLLLGGACSSLCAQKEEGVFALFPSGATDYTSPTMTVRMKANGVDPFLVADISFEYLKNKTLVNSNSRVILYHLGCIGPNAKSYDGLSKALSVLVPEQGGNIPMRQYCETLFQCELPDVSTREPSFSTDPNINYVGFVFQDPKGPIYYWFDDSRIWPTGDDEDMLCRDKYTALKRVVEFMGKDSSVVTDPIYQWGSLRIDHQFARVGSNQEVVFKYNLTIASNSRGIFPEDTRIEIDDKTVYSGYKFDENYRGDYICFPVTPGKHQLKATSGKCDEEFIQEFEVPGSQWASIDLKYDSTKNTYNFIFEPSTTLSCQ
jgi:hypothetical protein